MDHMESGRQLSSSQVAENGRIDQLIARAISEATLGLDLLRAGVTVVGLDDDGHLVEYRPDGSSTILS